ncbi:MAG: hypothetical protein HY866_22660, partial [Chloroflexi bacterium]|nr:hypothetical protein [Chloroflexota bacterium]
FDSRASYLTYSPDGRLIAGAESDQIILWDARSGTKVTTIEQGFSSSRLVFTSDSQELLSNDGSNLVFYSASDGRVLNQFECRCGVFDLSPDGELIVLHTYEDQVRLVSSFSGTVIRELGSEEDYLSQIEFSPDGRFVVAAGSGGLMIVWNAVTGETIFDGNSNLSSSDQFAFHPTENTLVLGQSSEMEFYAVDEQGLRFLRSNDLGESFFSIQGLTYSADGKEIALGNFFNGVWLWNVDDKRVTYKLKSEEGIDTVAFSPDGRSVIGAGWFGDIYEWQVRGEAQNVQQPTEAPRLTDVTATFTPTPASAFPALMRSPTPLPLVAATPAAPVDCTVRPAAQAARIRSGPGTEYAVMGNLSATASANGQLTGADNFTWWRLADGRGWVREDVVEEIGSCDQLPQAS